LLVIFLQTLKKWSGAVIAQCSDVLWMNGHGLIPGKGTGFFSLLPHQNKLWDTSSLL